MGARAAARAADAERGGLTDTFIIEPIQHDNPAFRRERAQPAEHRDPETGGHIMRTRRYARQPADHIKRHDKYKHFLTVASIDMLYKSAPLHDIGRVGVPDRILLKESPLTE